MERFEKVFVDANYFIALFNETDSLHQKAKEIGAVLDRNKQSLIISNFIFLEIVTVVSLRRGKETARVVGSSLLEAPHIEMIHVGSALHQRSWKLFEKVEQKNISFVDCSTAILMEDENIHTLLTFDTKDFNVLQKHVSFQFLSTGK